jgi:hypothetical protein
MEYGYRVFVTCGSIRRNKFLAMVTHLQNSAATGLTGMGSMCGGAIFYGKRAVFVI